MCVELKQLEEAMGAYAASFDAALLSAAQAEGVMERAARIEHMAAAVKGAAAARVAETELWRQGGDRTPAHMLGRRTGQNVSQAKDAIDTAKRLKDRPKTDAAARAGKLSPQQAAAIADAAEADPKSEDDLLELAPRASLPELRDECARRKAAAQDPEELHRRIHDERKVRSWTGADGRWKLSAEGTPDAGAEFMAVLRAKADKLFNEARKAGRREPSEAYMFDALMGLASDAGAPATGSRSSRTKVLVRVDFETLLRGHAVEGEVCEIAGFGPVPISVVEEILSRGDTFLAAVITRGVTITGVAHLGRPPTAFQRSGLEWLYPTCAREGCAAPVKEWDHRIDWSKTHITLFDWIDGLCGHDHDLKTYEGWALVEGVGKRAMVPPDDPQHPNNAKAHERPPPAAA